MDVLKYLVQKCPGIQNPVRGLSQVSKDKLPDIRYV